MVLSRLNVFGKDIYILWFQRRIRRLVPAGTDTTNAEQVKDCSKTGTGFFCLSLVKNRGWKLVDINIIVYAGIEFIQCRHFVL